MNIKKIITDCVVGMFDVTDRQTPYTVYTETIEFRHKEDDEQVYMLEIEYGFVEYQDKVDRIKARLKNIETGEVAELDLTELNELQTALEEII